jgi:cysteine synthase A
VSVLDNVLAAVGGTPVVRLNKVKDDCAAEILAKLEMFNPSGSSKARAALGMILAAEKDGIIGHGSVIVEATSGNQGIALAMVGAVKGYKVVVVMPETMSVERRKLIQAYGAELVLTPKEEDVQGAVKRAKEIVEKTPNAWIPDQFSNPVNPAFHEQTTAREILEQAGSTIHALVIGVGTGGTLTGVARVLKKACPEIEVYAVEPENSAVIAGKPPGEHMLQGIGDGFVPDNLDKELLTAAIPVSDRDALKMTRRLASEEGLLVGVSSGASVVAAVQVGKKLGQGKRVLTILPDTGERYLSTPIFDF